MSHQVSLYDLIHPHWDSQEISAVAMDSEDELGSGPRAFLSAGELREILHGETSESWWNGLWNRYMGSQPDIYIYLIYMAMLNIMVRKKMDMHGYIYIIGYNMKIEWNGYGMAIWIITNSYIPTKHILLINPN